MKFCPKCKRKRKEKSYSKNSSRFDGLQAYCKNCTAKEGSTYFTKNKVKIMRKRKHRNVRVYWPHLTPLQAVKEFKKLLIFQKGKCAICKSNKKWKTRLHIDHDHQTKNIRGILCVKCNVGLGYFEDNINRLKQAIKYLQK